MLEGAIVLFGVVVSARYEVEVGVDGRITGAEFEVLLFCLPDADTGAGAAAADGVDFAPIPCSKALNLRLVVFMAGKLNEC